MLEIPFDQLIDEKEWRACAPDWNTSTQAELLAAFQHFCEKHWTIRHPERGRIKFLLREAQIETVETWLGNRYTIVLKARQIGFSTLAAAYAVWVTWFYSDRQVVMLSRTERDAIKLLEKAKYGFKMLPSWMKERGPMVDVKQTAMTFSNDSKIESLPSGNDPARGESLFLIIVDEWAFLPSPADAWSSIEPVVDIAGSLIGLSTANGEGDTFHELWEGSQNGTNRFVGIFFPWWAGDRDDEWYEAKKRDLPDWQLAQEYPSNPEEAFLRSGRPVFNVDQLRLIEPVEPERGHLRDRARGIDFVADGGPLSVWEVPKDRGVYCIGADVAEGLEHGDFSSAHVIDARNLRVVAHWHGKIDPDLFGSDVLNLLGTWFNTALIGVESNNHGLTTLKALQQAKYRNIYHQRRLGKTTTPTTDILGFRTTMTSKPLVIDDLGRVIREDSLVIPCAKTIQELKTFVREGNGKMHGSPWDDRTMSMALAVWMLRHVFAEEYMVKPKPGPGTMGWLEKMLYGDDMKKDRKLIGSTAVRERV